MARSPTARAWRVHRLGAPREALALDTVALRPPGPGEALVDVAAVGLNFPDLLLCAGAYQERPEPPFTPGYEAAGTVREAGPGSAFAPGDPVIVVPELPGGALQECLTVPDAQLYPIPADLPATIAATLHIAYQTAHVALHRRARLRPGESVLVDGAAGGVGLAAVQLARAAGARVLAVATGPGHLEACRRAGADVLIDATDAVVVAEAVRDATGGRGADVVLDIVGGELFDAARRSVAFEGRIVVIGFTSGSIPAVPANHVLLRTYSVVGLHLAAYRREAPHVLRATHQELLELLAAGAIEPRVDRVVAFEEAPRGLEAIAAREVIGRAVVAV